MQAELKLTCKLAQKQIRVRFPHPRPSPLSSTQTHTCMCVCVGVRTWLWSSSSEEFDLSGSSSLCREATRWHHTPPPSSPPPASPSPSHSHSPPPTRHDRCLSGSSQITKAPPFQSSLSSSPTHLQRQGSRNMFPRQAGRQAGFAHAHTHYDIAHLQTSGREHFQQRRGVKTGHSQDTATCHIDATSLHSLPPGDVLRRASRCLPVSLILYPLGCERASHKCITQADVIRAFVKIKQSEKWVWGTCS